MPVWLVRPNKDEYGALCATIAITEQGKTYRMEEGNY